MHWALYKALCDQPRVFTRWMLEQTLRLVDDDLGLMRVLARPPLPKPPGHKGDERTDTFQLTLNRAQIGIILAAIERAVHRGQTTSETAARGLGGFLEAWREYDDWLMQTERDRGMSAQQLVTAMIDGFNRMDLDGIVACFAEDAVYHNIPTDPVTGPDAIRAVLEGFMGMATEVQWDVLSTAENGNVVLNERVDKFLVNGTWIELPVMGTFEVSEGKIIAWRDYFDMAQFQNQMQAAMG